MISDSPLCNFNNQIPLTKENMLIFFSINSILDDYSFTKDFIIEKTHNIEEAIHKDNDNRIYVPTQYFLYAGIRSGITIYADKKLFGREAGSDLKDCFLVFPTCLNRMIVSYPDYKVLYDYTDADYPTTFDDYFISGNALPREYGYDLTFATIPEENYDELTFTFEVPYGLSIQKML